jgi:hypothetical protein
MIFLDHPVPQSGVGTCVSRSALTLIPRPSISELTHQLPCNLPSQTPTNPSSHILLTKNGYERDKIIQNHHQLIFFSFPKKSIATPRYTVSAAPLRPASRASEPFESSASHRREPPLRSWSHPLWDQINVGKPW